jgi:hypothetical protein
MSMLVTLNQDTDTPARREITPVAILTYLYDRSRDSKQSNALGQDFIAYRYASQRITFAVCDGVSQSFYGDLAARFLGERLVLWLDEFPAVESEFAADVDGVLRVWTDEATRLVEAKSVNPHLAPMIRDALDRKRENGSETMFVAGIVDFEQHRLAVCWMGDMRLWLWDAAGNPVDLPGAEWLTRERWSTRVGPKNGDPRTAIVPLENVARITIHSDGVGSRAPELASITLDELNQLARDLSMSPASDDVSILDIAIGDGAPTPVTATLATPHPRFPDPDEPVLEWDAVEGAEWYRVACKTDDRQWTSDTHTPTFFIPLGLTGTVEYRVQALASDRAPSMWSAPIQVTMRARGEGVPPVHAAFAQVGGAAEPIVSGVRPFQVGVVMALALLLSLVLSVGWYFLYLR